MRLRTKAQRVAEILEEVPDLPGAPDNLLRHLRGQSHQTEIAAKGLISQGYYSELESGKKPLTPAVAERLAPVLGVTASELIVSGQLVSLKAMADRGGLEPQRMLDAIQELSWSLPEGQVSDDLVEALLAVLKRALETYDAHEKARAKVATKSAASAGSLRKSRSC